MRNLTIENFLNEMSYDLRMEELENVVRKYQEVVLRYVLGYQYIFKEKKRMHEVFEVLRSEKYLATLEKMVEDTDGVLEEDLAYIVVTAADFAFVDREIKARAMTIAYKLRESNFVGIKSIELRQLLTTLSVWTVRSFETNAYFKSKALAKIIEKFPRVAHNAFGGKHVKIDNSAMLKVFGSLVPGVVIEDIVSAFLYSDYKYTGDTVEAKYAIKLRSFFYTLCGVIDQNKFVDALGKVCGIMATNNVRHAEVQTFQGRYLDYNLFCKLAKDFKESGKELDNASKAMITAHDTLTRFIMNNKEYESLFI